MANRVGAGSAGRSWARVRGRRAWQAVPRELALVATGVILYFGVRGLTVGNADVAVGHAHDIVSWEKGLGLYVEPSMQDSVDDWHWLTTVMNWVYISGHWPVIVVTLLWLVLDHPAGYRVTRNAMLASGAVGLVVFAFYPVAPPRLADLGLVDTVTSYSSAYRVLQPQTFVNQYAAMPSLHVGWDLLIGIALVTCGRHPGVRVIGVLLPVFMAASVIATANHYVADVVAGIALVLVCRVAALRSERRRAPQPRRRRGDVPRAWPAPATPSRARTGRGRARHPGRSRAGTTDRGSFHGRL